MFLRGLMILFMGICLVLQGCRIPDAAQSGRYHPGQRWRYLTRPQEQDSTLLILKSERLTRLGNVIHIAVYNVKIQTGKKQGETIHTITHAPVSEALLNESVTQMVEENVPLPDFSHEYAEWLSEGQGVFTIPVSKIVEVSEKGVQTVERNHGHHPKPLRQKPQ